MPDTSTASAGGFGTFAKSVATVAALQTVGAFLVIAMVVIPGATAYLLTDRFSFIIIR